MIDTLNMSQWQGISIEALEKWLMQARAEGKNVLMFDVDWGYYDSIDGIDLRVEKKGQEDLALLRKDEKERYDL